MLLEFFLNIILRGDDWAPFDAWESQFSLRRAGPIRMERAKSKLEKSAIQRY